MNPVISIIIPNYNGSRTIGACLDAVYQYKDSECEVIVVDDCSEDSSCEIIGRYPCRLIRLSDRKGAAAARNAGARSSSGKLLFFIDADCLLKEDTIAAAREQLSRHGPRTIIGGTYTPQSADPGFFSLYQSAFINYYETKNSADPDYIATHAMIIYAETFRSAGGFREDFLPILEDVEFSHRLRSAGYAMLVDPGIQVRHIFNFNAMRSLGNAARKTEFWLVYSFRNRDLLADSGTASREVKLTGILWLSFVAVVLASLLINTSILIPSCIVFSGVGFLMNRRLFRAFRKAGGLLFACQASAYHLLVYPAGIWLGTVRAVRRHIQLRRRQHAAHASM